jgi:hypothetical protein
MVELMMLCLMSTMVILKWPAMSARWTKPVAMPLAKLIQLRSVFCDHDISASCVILGNLL